MTALALVRTDPLPPQAPGTPPRSALWARLGLLLICLSQVALAVVPRRNGSPFEDEGLYVYMGHRMLEHLLHGSAVTEYPGAYFSGAPGLYPVLAALGDGIGGLQGARAVSLLFAIGATVCVHGLGRQLFGVREGLLGAAAFALCGPVVFQSGLATFDSMSMSFVAAAAWLTARSVQQDRYLWAPVVSVLMVGAVAAKYGGAIFLPVIALLAIAVSDPRHVMVVSRRAVFMLAGTAGTLWFLYTLWGQSLREGILSTTVSRAPMNPAGPGDLAWQVVTFVGPWLLLAVLGAVLRRRSRRVSAVLLIGAVLMPLQQINMGEATSLSKHLAFGMVFAAPLVGVTLATLLERFRVVTAPLVVALLVLLGGWGLRDADRLLNGWVPNDALVPALRTLIEASPGKTVLGDQPSPERYLLRADTEPLQWVDTYSFGYDDEVGMPAYQRAVEQTAFGVIYLAVESNTRYGQELYAHLSTTDTPYKQVATIDRELYGEPAGQWVLYMPEVTPTPDLGTP